MTTNPRQRLSGILVADAVGYSRLMEANERATLALLEAARSTFRDEAGRHGGRVVNTAGDSVLAVFETAAGAVEAALAIQRTLESAAADAPIEQRLRFRIGVHLGDVIEVPDGDVYGDGVNIAARLQAIAPAGGIVVSDAIRGAVKTRVAASFADLGPQAVKNISDRIRAFALADGESIPPVRRGKRRAPVVLAALVAAVLAVAAAWYAFRAAPPQLPVAAAPAAKGAKPSIAVLPFDSVGGDPDRAYFADGMTEDIITDLSKAGGLIVIARNSSFRYRGEARDVRDIGRALNAQFVLQGSVRRNGDRVRVNVQLVDSATGAQIWADRYDGDIGNVFALQDTIARNVVRALLVDLTKDESDRVSKRGTANVQAYDLVLRGWDNYLKQTPDAFKAAIQDFKSATEIDPGYGRAWAALAAIYWEAYTRYWGPALGLPRHTQYEAEQSLAKAMRDPTPLAHEVASAMHLHAQQHDAAVQAAHRAIAADPNDADGYTALAGALSFSGRPSEALVAVERAMRLNPHYPSSYAYQRGLALFGENRLPEAAASLERAIELNRNDYWSQRLLLAVYGLLGRTDDAKRLLLEMNTFERGRYATYDPLTVPGITYWFPFARPDDAKRFASGLAKAGVPG